MKLGPFSKRACGGPERGYVLLVISLAAALLAISLAAMDINTRLQLRRDREEEMIHRGVEYARAIRKFQKKFARFPAKFEDLENTNNLRFLRRKYKDPITNADWTPLRFGDVKLATNTTVPAAALGSAPGTPIASAGAQPGSAPGISQSGTTSGLATRQGTASAPGAQTFGGGAIVGVASSSEDQSIREFGGKNHYNEWQFIAITLPGNTIIRGPYVPTQGGILGAGIPGTPGTPAVPGAPGQTLPPGRGGRGPRR